MNPDQELVAILREAEIVVSYAPLTDEPNPRAFLSAHGFRGRVVHAPQDHHVAPHDFAAVLHELHIEKDVCMLIPGRKFDAFGTRHGHGLGWYDRLLALVPRRWKRIGLALPHHVSPTKLVRKSWDQPMDYVFVFEEGNWRRL